MRKDEYLNILSDRLNVLPADEYRDIMEYYKEYFEEAGKDNEEEVIRDLGDVEELARRIIRENMGDRMAGQPVNPETYGAGKGIYNQNTQAYNTQNGAYTHMNMPYSQNNEPYTQINGQPYAPYQPKSSGLSTGWKVVIAILTSPLWLGLVIGALGIIFGFGFTSVACFFAGIASIIAGIAIVGASFATCIFFVGVGFIIIAVALGFLMATVSLARLVIKAFNAIFGKKEVPYYM